jgi:hypothetical protein
MCAGAWAEFYLMNALSRVAYQHTCPSLDLSGGDNCRQSPLPPPSTGRGGEIVENVLDTLH